ncbi:MAG: adenosylcobinamide-GDP ribazoletransferase [Prevotella sp.]
MRISLNTSKWYDNVWAALTFFTRLPLWRIYCPPRSSYAAVVEFWPLAGWVTGGLMAATLYLGALVFPYPIAVLSAVAVRILLTGALHEDGLADFFDGFGGGSDRQRILDIMKDSRIGTYGVISLVIYLLILGSCLLAMPPELAAISILAADPYAKMIAGQFTTRMPYARDEATSKAKIVYRPMSIRAGILLFIQGMLPSVPLFVFFGHALRWESLVFIPCIVCYFIYIYIMKKIHGYTGDCCGAMFLLTELSCYLAIVYMY